MFFFIYAHYKIAIPDLYFNSLPFDYIFLLCLRRFSINLSYNISRFVIYQAVIQVLLSMRTTSSRQYSNSISLHSRQLDNFCPTFFNYSAHSRNRDIHLIRWNHNFTLGTMVAREQEDLPTTFNVWVMSLIKSTFWKCNRRLYLALCMP